MILKYAVIGFHRKNPAVSFLVNTFFDKDEAETCRLNTTKSYEYEGESNWDFVIQNRNNCKS